MIQPDIICSWPNNLDYPAFRSQLTMVSNLVGSIIIVFTNPHKIDEDYRDFIVNNLKIKNVIFSNNPDSSGDWRDNAVNEGLTLSQAEWVLFLEQDFIFTADCFLKLTNPLAYEAVAHQEGTRWHPACFLVKRDIIEKTSRYFGVVTDKLDHFGSFAQEVEALTPIGSFHDLRIHPSEGKHFGGITHNFTLFKEGFYDQIYQPEMFVKYNELNMKAEITQDPRFQALTNKIAAHYAI